MPLPTPPDHWNPPPADVVPDSLQVAAIRGQQIRMLRTLLLSTVAPDRLARAAEAVPPASAALLTHDPDPTAWVPTSEALPLLALGHRLTGGLLIEQLPHFNAERDAGRLPWMVGASESRVLPESDVVGFFRQLPKTYGTYFQGGEARLDHLEGREAWVSFWMGELYPGWAATEPVAWFQWALRGGYGLEPRVTYRPPEPDRPWWHRFHVAW